MSDMVIRPAVLADAEKIHQNCKTGSTLEQVRHQVAWTSRERAPQVLEHLVAEVDGDAVGNIMMVPKGAHAVQLGDGWITLCRGRNGYVAPVVRLDDWVVAGRYHGTGVAVRLAEAVVALAAEWGAAQVESSSPNPRAIGCLSKLGFREWGRYPHANGDVEVFVVRNI